MGADTKANTMVWVRVLSSVLERGEGRVALEALCDRSSAFRSELIAVETAQAHRRVFAFLSMGVDTKANTLLRFES